MRPSFLQGLLLCVAFKAAWAEGLTACADGRLSVAGTGATVPMVCDGGSRALAFLSGIGLALPDALQVEVVDRLSPLYGAGQLGSFDANAGRIRVLDYDACRALDHEGLLFGQPISPDLYRSIVAHEVAHAVVTFNFRAAGPHLVPQEYLAYTTQLVVMSAALRRRILHDTGVSAFASEHEISAMRYLLDPQGFGIAAYRHFAALPDSHTFVQRLLKDEVRYPRLYE